MVRLPRVSGKEAGKAFEKLGYQFRRMQGSHMIYKIPGGATISIPNHRELDAGLLRHLISDSSITPEEFRELLDLI